MLVLQGIVLVALAGQLAGCLLVCNKLLVLGFDDAFRYRWDFASLERLGTAVFIQSRLVPPAHRL